MSGEKKYKTLKKILHAGKGKPIDFVNDSKAICMLSSVLFIILYYE